jgi:hypothetical protein
VAMLETTPQKVDFPYRRHYAIRNLETISRIDRESTQPLGGRNQSLQKVERQNQQRNGTRHVLYVLMEVIESSMQLVCPYLCPDWLLGWLCKCH